MVIAGLLWMAAANAGVLFATWAVFKQVRTGSSSLDAALFLFLRLAIITLTILVAGCASFLSGWKLGLLGAAATAVFLALRQRLPLRLRSLQAAVPGRLAAAALALAVARLAAQIWVLAPFNADVCAYHLPKVAAWIRAGAFVWEIGPDVRAAFPAGFELVETWWALFLHHDVIIEMAGVEFLLLGVVSVHAIARRIGLSEAVAFWAAFLFSLTPGFLLQAVACLNDAPVASLWLFAAALLLNAAPPGLVLGAVGLGIGVKPTFAYAVPGLLLLAWLSRSEPASAPSNRRWAWIVAGSGMVLGSFWYVKNLVVFGSPVFPMSSSGILHPRSQEVLQQFGPQWTSLATNLGILVGERVYDREAITAIHEEVSGFGAAVFAGAPALTLALLESTVLRRFAAAIALSAGCVLLMVRTDLFFARFLLFVPPLFILALAHAAAKARGFALLAVVAGAIQVVSTFAPGETPSPRLRFLANKSWRERAVAVTPVDLGTDRVGYLAEMKANIYGLYGPAFSHDVVPLRASSRPELVEELRKKQVRWVSQESRFERTRAMVRECEKAGELILVSGRFYRVP
jgi:hypothetical protein